MTAREMPAGAEAAPLLSVEDLKVSFRLPQGAIEAVRGISFTVNAGEIVGIVGESGSGKSVTCRALLGLLPGMAARSGRVMFDGRDLLTLSEAAMRAVRGRDASMIFQNPASHLDPLMTIGRQIGEPLRFHFGFDRARSRDAVVRMLDDVRIRDPETRAASYPHELSGGMKQRAMIAAAIACEPRLLVADEPTTALDVTVQARILDLLRHLNRARGLAIILISHDLGVIAGMCDRVVVMRNGEIVEQGPTPDVIGRPQHPYTRLLIDSQPGAAACGGRASPGGAAGRPLLAVEALSVEFGAPRAILPWGRRGGAPVRAVDDVGFTVHEGESFGIVGESGSGKSTIARVIARLVEPTAGSVRFRGESVLEMKGQRLTAFRRAVQMVFQNPFDSLNPRMTVEQTIAEPMIRHGLATRRQAVARAAELMELVELPADLAHRRPRQLSGGQCQRVGIARALALEPELLIADEITSALDVTIQAQMLALLRRLRERKNLTIIYISHDLAVVRSFCQRVAVFQAGRLVEMGEIEEVMTRPREAYTRELIAAAPRLPAAHRDGRKAVSGDRARTMESERA